MKKYILLIMILYVNISNAQEMYFQLKNNAAKPLVSGNIVNFIQPEINKLIGSLDVKPVLKHPEKFHSKWADSLARTYVINIKKISNFDRLELESGLNSVSSIKYVEISDQPELLSCPTDDPAEQEWNSSRLDMTCVLDAFCITHGNPNIIIAARDNGFMQDHPELDGKVVYAEPGAYNGACHGTTTACTSAGATDNGFGLCSSGYDCSLALYLWGYDFVADYEDMILRGVRIAHNSYIYSCSPITAHQYIINLATENGLIIVGSAGNGNAGNGIAACGGNDYNSPTYPSAYDNVISVSSIGDDYCCETTYNYWGDDFDPPLHHTHNNTVDLLAQGYYVSVAACNGDEQVIGYGTSFAGPHVAGIIGLMLSVNPCLNHDDVLNILQSTGQDVTSVCNNSSYYPGGAPPVPCAEAAVIAAQSYKGPDIIVNNNEEWDQRYVSGDVYIKAGATLKIFGVVSMGENCRIIVERGAKLILDGGVITSCNETWPGIIVEGNSSLPQPDPDGMPAPDEAGIVITQNGATIENAHIGISTNYVGDWSDQYWGGVVHCENTDFVNCWKGVEFMKYDYENKGYFNHCTFKGWKEGVTIWACHGVTFNHCTFDDKYKGIAALDADFVVQYGNTFSNCDYGIEASATSPYRSFVEVIDNNSFYDNDFTLDFSGLSSRVERNYLEDNTNAVLLDGDNKYFVEDNSFGLNGYNIISDATGYNYNWINCNNMYSQYGGIWMGYDNQKTTFLSNDFTGTASYGFDYFGWKANIIDEVGNKDDISAMNSFSGVEKDIDSREENGNEYFEYFVPPNATADLIPDYPGNYLVRHDGSDDAMPCSTIEPPIVTTKEISILLRDYCYWWGLYRQNPKNWNYKWKFHQAERKFLYKYYWWYRQRYEEKSWEEIEEILKELCSDRWKVRLYGFYMRTSQYDKAEAVLNELDDPSRAQIPIVPEDLSDESRASFIAVQRINLKYQESSGAYQPTESQLNTLRTEAVKDIPERAYARGLLLLTTGEKFDREVHEGLEQRESKTNSPDNWSVYPNPTDNMIHIYTNGEFAGNITIYNLMGSKMLEKNVISENKTKIDMDVSTLNDGVYLLIVRDSENNLIKSEKVIVGSFK